MKYIIFYLFISFNIYAQKTYKVKLTERAYYKGFISIKQNAYKVKTGILKTDSLFFQISILDQNNNGKFNDIGKDLITLTNKFNNSLRVHDGVANSLIQNDNVILINDKYYKISYIEPNGSYLKITECYNCNKYTIKVVNKLPNISFELISSENNFFNKFKGKYTFVEFWGTWCKGCVQILPNLKEIYNNNSDVLNVIYLNSYDTKEEIKTFILKHRISNFINGHSTKEIEKEFLLNGYPYGILFDKNGKLVKEACTLKELNEYLKNDK